MKTKVHCSLLLGLTVATLLSSGCASRCGDGFLQRQPVRSTIRSWFGGDDCNTCNPPCGQSLYSPNTAGMCDTCNSGQIIGSSTQPMYGAPMQGAQMGGDIIPGAQPGPVSGGLGEGANPPQL